MSSYNFISSSPIKYGVYPTKRKVVGGSHGYLLQYGGSMYAYRHVATKGGYARKRPRRH